MSALLQRLEANRGLLLACEAIGWIHMAGKAHAEFVKQQGSGASPPSTTQWNELEWTTFLPKGVNDYFAWLPSCSGQTIDAAALLRDHREKHDDIRGLLQAAHGMASGIEKNTPADYQKQPQGHAWLTTAFGHPVSNLLTEPPEVLGGDAWANVVSPKLGELLKRLEELGNASTSTIDEWHAWRRDWIGSSGWLRRQFSMTLAETRVPNNDVTLWDQSYVAAALFKAAAAGAILGQPNDWTDLKQQTRWRVLTVGLGAEHYEARAIRIGDWTGTREAIRSFFDDVCRYLEVEIAIGACIYRDERLLAFAFPGFRADASNEEPKGSVTDTQAEDEICPLILEAVDRLASSERYRFETPPCVSVSKSTRSLIELARQTGHTRRTMETPVHRDWTMRADDSRGTHVCPVSLVRPTKGGPRKETPSRACHDRRTGRLARWMQQGGDTIWISEVADHNDRVALVTLSLGLETWLDGTGVDGLRVHSIGEWARHNQVSGGVDTPGDHATLIDLIRQGLPTNDNQARKIRARLLKKLSSGFEESDWPRTFYERMVEDRADAPTWNDVEDDSEQRARWLAHQLLRKNASPGRVHRFWRSALTFFEELLDDIRGALRSGCVPSRGARRLLKVSNTVSDRMTYTGRLPDQPEVPFEVVYLKELDGLVTICNLARLLDAPDRLDGLAGQVLDLEDDDHKSVRITIASQAPAPTPLDEYDPMIVLEENPERFRLLVPLANADACVDLAVRKWRREMARVWDRLPLHVGVVAFPRKTPYQAVIEAARNIEDELAATPECWRVVDIDTRDRLCALSLRRKDGEPELRTVPVRLADGRDDFYYPNIAIADREPREPHDFLAPRKDAAAVVYRWTPELHIGDGAQVAPSRFARVFLDSTARRFEPLDAWHLGDWELMRAVWELVRRCAPSSTAARNVEGLIARARSEWTDSDGNLDMSSWSAFVRATLINHWDVDRAALDSLVDAGRRGVLEEALRWHLHVLKLDPKEAS